MYPFQSHNSEDGRSHLIENSTFDLNMAKSNVRHLILIENSTSDLNNVAKSISVQSALHHISSIFRAIPVERQDRVGNRGVQCNTINVLQCTLE